MIPLPIQTSRDAARRPSFVIGGRMWASAPTHVYRSACLIYVLSFRASPQTGVEIRSPRPQARKTLASLCEGGVKTEGFDGGRDKIETGGAKPRPYAHLSRVCGTYIPVRPYASSTGIRSTTSRPCRMAYSTVRRVPPSCPSNTAITRPLCSTI